MMTVRRVCVDYNYFGTVWSDLPAIASGVSSGVHHRTQSGESDEDFLRRVAAEIEREFMEQAGDVTGAANFAFTARLVE